MLQLQKKFYWKSWFVFWSISSYYQSFVFIMKVMLEKQRLPCAFIMLNSHGSRLEKYNLRGNYCFCVTPQKFTRTQSERFKMFLKHRERRFFYYGIVRQMNAGPQSQLISRSVYGITLEKNKTRESTRVHENSLIWFSFCQGNSIATEKQSH